jgi:hypothetical protein
VKLEEGVRYDIVMTSFEVGVTGEVTLSYTAQGLTNGTTYYFIVQAVDKAGNIISVSNEVSATPVSPVVDEDDDDDDIGGGNDNTGQTPPASNGVEVRVNGQVIYVGTKTTSEEDGRTITTIAIDEQRQEELLKEVGEGATVTIPIDDESDVLVGELTARLVKTMSDQQAVLEVRTGSAVYTLPAQQINIDAISEQFGQSIPLEEIKIQVEIAAPSDETAALVESAAAVEEFTLVVPAINFTVRAVHGDKQVEVAAFNMNSECSLAKI